MHTDSELQLKNLQAAARLLKAAAVAANFKLFVYSEMAKSYSALRKHSFPFKRCLQMPNYCQFYNAIVESEHILID